MQPFRGLLRFEGPVIVFLTIFLVLLYHLTCVLHSISLAKESLEAGVAACWDTGSTRQLAARRPTTGLWQWASGPWSAPALPTMWLCVVFVAGTLLQEHCLR